MWPSRSRASSCSRCTSASSRPTDYGVIAVLFVVEQLLRVLYRWGVDAAFMRFYYDCADTTARQTLASTLFFFLHRRERSALAAGLAASPWLVAAAVRLGRLGACPSASSSSTTFLGCLSFLPFHVLRIEGRARHVRGAHVFGQPRDAAHQARPRRGPSHGRARGVRRRHLVAAGVLVGLVLLPRTRPSSGPVFSRPGAASVPGVRPAAAPARRRPPGDRRGRPVRPQPVRAAAARSASTASAPVSASGSSCF